MPALTSVERRRILLEVVDLIVEIISSRPLGMPSGELYSMLMDKMSLATYTRVIELLVDAGRITCESHLLKAVSR